MLVSSMPSKFLVSSIDFIATIAMAGPFLAALLRTLRDFYFWDPLKFAKLWGFDTLALMVFEWVSARHVLQPQW